MKHRLPGGVAPGERREDMEGYTIRCGGHNYITLEYNEKFIFCLDNDMYYAEEMIHDIEKKDRNEFSGNSH